MDPKYLDTMRRRQAIREAYMMGKGKKITNVALAEQLGCSPQTIANDMKEMQAEIWEDMASDYKRLFATGIARLERIGERIEKVLEDDSLSDDPMQPSVLAAFYKQQQNLIEAEFRLYKQVGLIPDIAIATSASKDSEAWADFYTKFKEVEMEREANDTADEADNEK